MASDPQTVDGNLSLSALETTVNQFEQDLGALLTISHDDANTTLTFDGNNNPSQFVTLRMVPTGAAPTLTGFDLVCQGDGRIGGEIVHLAGYRPTVKMAKVDQSQLVGKIRDRPIIAELEELLTSAAQATGIDIVLVTSGGQPGSSGRSAGSTRHNGGRAADLELIRNGQSLTFTDEDGGIFFDFVAAAAARGAIGIGAGIQYMGKATIHVGFGTSPDDQTRVVWGAGGHAATAPDWLRQAAAKGWSAPAPALSGVVGESEEEIGPQS